MRALTAVIFAAVLTSASAADDRFIAGDSGRSVRETVAGLQWPKVDTRYLPDGVTVEIAHIAGRDTTGAYQYSDLEVIFPNGVRIRGGGGQGDGAFGGCLHADGTPNLGVFASFCRDWPEFRQAVLVMIVLGYEDIAFTGEFQNWSVDLNELDISREDILAYAETAAALNPSNEDN